MEQPPTAIPPYKARPSQNWPKIATYDHVHQIFIPSCTWFRRGVLCDRGLRQNLWYLCMMIYASLYLCMMYQYLYGNLVYNLCVSSWYIYISVWYVFLPVCKGCLHITSCVCRVSMICSDIKSHTYYGRVWQDSMISGPLTHQGTGLVDTLLQMVRVIWRIV